MKSIAKYLDVNIDFKIEEAKAINLAKKGYYSNEIIKRYNLDDENILINACELISYQEDAKICSECSGLNRCPKNSRGLKMVITKKDMFLDLGYTYCKYYQEKQLVNKYLDYLKYTNIGTNHFEYRIESLASLDNLFKDRFNVLNKMLEIVANYPIKTYGLYVSGDTGVGKTMILTTMITELLNREYECGYVSMPDLLLELRAKMNDVGYYDLMEMLKNIPVLAIDDLGLENVSTWSRDDVLARIIDARYDKGLLTVFGSGHEFNDLIRVYQIDSRDFKEKAKINRLVNRIRQLSEPIVIRK